MKSRHDEIRKKYGKYHQPLCEYINLIVPVVNLLERAEVAQI